MAESLTLQAWATCTPISTIANTTVMTLSLDDCLGTAAKLINATPDSAVIIANPANQPHYIITGQDIVLAIAQERPLNTRLAEFMPASAICVPANLSIQAAAQLAIRHGIGHLLVLDDKGQLYGIASGTDFCRALITLLPPKTVSITSFFNPSVPQAAVGATGFDIARLLVQRASRCALIGTVGYVTAQDLSHLYANGTLQDPIIESVLQPVAGIPLATCAHNALKTFLASPARHVLVMNATGQTQGFMDGQCFLKLIAGLPAAIAHIGNAHARILLDQIPDLVWLKDSEGVYLACNGRFEQLYGATEAQIIGKTDYDFVKPEIADFFRAHDRTAIEQGEACKNEEWLDFAANGYRGLFETIKTTVHDNNGNVVGVLGIARDITERKQLEQSLREAEAKFHGLAEQSLVGIYIIQNDKFCYASPGFAKLFGYPSVKDLIHKMPVHALVAQDSRQLVSDNINLHLTGKTPELTYSFKGLRKDGRIIDIDVHGHTFEFNGQPAIIGLCVDTSERQRWQRRERSRVHFLDAMAQGISLPELLERLVLTIEEQIPDCYCSVLLLDPKTQRLQYGAAPHLPTFYNEAINGLAIGPGIGSCGTAAYEKRRVIAEDIPNHPYWQDFKKLAADAGLSACWSEPIFNSQGDVLGTFAIYWPHPHISSPDLEELDALSDAGHLASIAIERRAMETQLAENELHFRTLADSGQALIWTAGPDKGCDYFNQVWLDFTGRSLAQELGNGWVEGVHPDDVADCFRIYAEAFDQQERFSMDYRLRRADGEYRWLQDNGTPRYNSQGEFIGYIGHCLDITERKQAEQELRKFRTIADKANYGNAITAMDGQLLYVNPTMAHMHGWEEKDLVGQPLSILHNQEQMPRIKELLEKIGQNDGFIAEEVWHQHRDGSVFPTLMNTVLIRDDQGHPQFMAATAIHIGQRKRTEMALEKSESRLREAQHLAHIGNWELDLRDNYLYWSDEIYHIFEIGPGEFGASYEAFLERIHPDDRELVNQAYSASVRDHSPYEIAHRLLFADGRIKYVHEQGFTYYDDNGRPSRSVGTVQDVTQQSLSEQRIRQLAQAVEQSPASIVITGRDGNIEYVNESFCRVTGYPRDEVTGQNPRFLSAQTTPDSTFKALWNTLLQGKGWRGEFHNRRKNGETYIDLAHIVPLRQQDGTITHYVSVQEDITEKKRVAEELEQYRHRLEELVEQRTADLANAHRQLGETFDAMSRAGIAIHWVLAETGQLIDANQQACDMLGYSREEILGLSIADIDPNFDKPHYQAISQRLREQRQHRFESVNKHKDGHFIAVEATVYYLEASRQEPARIVGFLTDISPRKHAEEELLKSKRLAEAANQAKSDFLANMSHEIRTPMNAILGLTHLLGQKNLTPNEHDLVHKIQMASNSLLSIINDILDFSKIEAGHLEIEHSPFRLSAILDKIAIITSTAINKKAIEFVISPIPEEADFLQGDGLRLEQILINLTCNAVKFTEHGMIALEISIVRNWNNHIELRFAVHDTGIGIAADKQQQIFTAFSQADTSTTRHFGGTGLGLSICQRLVTLMGGVIGVNSKLGEGSEFWFALPFAKAPTDSYSPPKLTGQRLLIVDDNDIARETLATITQHLGWQAELAHSGQEAVTKFRQALSESRPFDIILMDWQMPGMDGLATSESIRSLCHDRPAPIIIMVTAYEHGQLMENPKRHVVNAVLNKPVTTSSLYDAVITIKAKVMRSALTHGIPPDLDSNPVGARLSGLRILVADDNEINREVAQLNLEAEGAIVAVADNGAEAIAWLQAHPNTADVVLMDVQMPIMDGYEATRHIRDKLNLPDLPIIALTAGVFKNQQDTAIASGMDAFIGKPFNIDSMVALLQQLTHHASITPALTADSTPAPTALPSLDAAKGLLLWRNIHKYHEYLGRFISNYAANSDDIAKLVETGRLEDAAAMAHKLKGAASSLALLKLADYAGLLESQLRQGFNTTNAVQQLTQAMNHAVQAIQTYTGIRLETPSPKNGVVDIEGSAPLLRQLLKALDQDTPDEAERLLGALAEKLPWTYLQAIRKAIEDFDFRQAEKQTIALAEELLIRLDDPL
jgi:PAS domain S-box-containing protein